MTKRIRREKDFIQLSKEYLEISAKNKELLKRKEEIKTLLRQYVKGQGKDTKGSSNITLQANEDTLLTVRNTVSEKLSLRADWLDYLKYHIKAGDLVLLDVVQLESKLNEIKLSQHVKEGRFPEDVFEGLYESSTSERFSLNIKQVDED
jgi:hypothetical protein